MFALLLAMYYIVYIYFVLILHHYKHGTIIMDSALCKIPVIIQSTSDDKKSELVNNVGSDITDHHTAYFHLNVHL